MYFIFSIFYINSITVPTSSTENHGLYTTENRDGGSGVSCVDDTNMNGVQYCIFRFLNIYVPYVVASVWFCSAIQQVYTQISLDDVLDVCTQWILLQ